MPQGNYVYDSKDFALLLIAKSYPERTDREALVIRAFLQEYITHFDRLEFGKRVGAGEPPDPTAPPNIQRQTLLNTQKRIDILAWKGRNPTIVEIKYRITPAALGQILTYRHHLLQDVPNAPEPEMVVVGQSSDADTTAALNAHGVTVILYPDAIAPSAAPSSGV